LDLTHFTVRNQSPEPAIALLKGNQRDFDVFDQFN
jgi:hypothetical protein